VGDSISIAQLDLGFGFPAACSTPAFLGASRRRASPEVWCPRGRGTNKHRGRRPPAALAGGSRSMLSSSSAITREQAGRNPSGEPLLPATAPGSLAWGEGD